MSGRIRHMSHNHVQGSTPKIEASSFMRVTTPFDEPNLRSILRSQAVPCVLIGKARSVVEKTTAILGSFAPPAKFSRSRCGRNLLGLPRERWGESNIHPSPCLKAAAFSRPASPRLAPARPIGPTRHAQAHVLERPPIDNHDMNETGIAGWGGQFRDQSFRAQYPVFDHNDRPIRPGHTPPAPHRAAAAALPHHDPPAPPAHPHIAPVRPAILRPAPLCPRLYSSIQATLTA